MSTPTATLVGNAEKIPSWVWRSNPQTAAAGVLSVTAAIEVIFAVAGYWAIAICTHGYSRLLTGVLVVPLFLLRSMNLWSWVLDGFRRLIPISRKI
jgi:hypothetical protein